MRPIASNARPVLLAVSGNVVYAAAQWLLVILIARLGSVQMLGEYAFALAVTAPAFMFANLRLRFVLASDLGRTPFAAYLKLRLLLTGVVVVAAVGIGLLLDSAGTGSKVLLAVIMYKVVEAIADVGLGLFQAREKMSLSGRALWLASGANIVAFTSVLAATGSLAAACVAMATSRLALLYSYEIPRWVTVEAERFGADSRPATLQILWGRASLDQVVVLFRKAWPLGGSAVLDSLNTNIPRYFVVAISGVTGLGAFAAMTSLSQGIFLLVNSFAQLRLPALARAAASSPRSRFWVNLSEVASAAVLLGIGGVLAAWLDSESILRFVFGEDFVHDAHALMSIMLAGLYAAMALVLTYALTALGDYRLQVLGYLACTIAIVVLCSLVPSGAGVVFVADALVDAQLVHVIVAGALLVWLGRRQAA